MQFFSGGNEININKASMESSMKWIINIIALLVVLMLVSSNFFWNSSGSYFICYFNHYNICNVFVIMKDFWWLYENTYNSNSNVFLEFPSLVSNSFLLCFRYHFRYPKRARECKNVKLGIETDYHNEDIIICVMYC